MGFYILDLFFRLERRFGVKLTYQDFLKLQARNADREILVGDLFDLVRQTAFRNGLLDEDIDGEETLWLLVLEELAMATGVEAEEISRDRGLSRDLDLF